MNYCDKILQPPLRLSAYVMEGKLKILGDYPKSGEMSFYFIFFVHFADFYRDYIDQNMFWL